MVFPGERRGNFFGHMHNGPNHSFNRPAPRNNIQHMIQRFSNPQSSATTLATKGVGGLSKALDNVQQVLKVVQTTTPIVQEYGPMVKNLPAMYRMMKAFKGIESDDDEALELEDKLENKYIEGSENKDYKNTEGKSTPKLFI